MTTTDPETFVKAARRAPLRSKLDWILESVAGKRVLDLGVVDHDLERALRNDEIWLHGQIKKKASYVVGIDIDKNAVDQLSKAGHNVIAGDATAIRLDEKFDVVVCGDLIEHVGNPLDLLKTISHHLDAGGRALISTPNPFSVLRTFNIWADGSIVVNPEHVFWLCPQTVYQMVSRSDLTIDKIVWLATDYPPVTVHRVWRRILNPIASRLASSNRLLSDDFGIELVKPA